MQTDNQNDKRGTVKLNKTADYEVKHAASEKETGPEKENIKFYYNREERLKKLRNIKEPKKTRLLSNRRIRTLLIIFIDLLIISLVIYFLNIIFKKLFQGHLNGEICELNITGIRGGKILIGFTVKNQNQENIVYQESVPIMLKIQGRNNEIITFQKFIEKNTVLLPEEATSMIFLIDEDELPRTGQLDVFYKTLDLPIFSQYIRF